MTARVQPLPGLVSEPSSTELVKQSLPARNLELSETLAQGIAASYDRLILAANDWLARLRAPLLNFLGQPSNFQLGIREENEREHVSNYVSQPSTKGILPPAYQHLVEMVSDDPTSEHSISILTTILDARGQVPNDMLRETSDCLRNLELTLLRLENEFPSLHGELSSITTIISSSLGILSKLSEDLAKFPVPDMELKHIAALSSDFGGKLKFILERLNEILPRFDSEAFRKAVVSAEVTRTIKELSPVPIETPDEQGYAIADLGHREEESLRTRAWFLIELGTPPVESERLAKYFNDQEVTSIPDLAQGFGLSESEVKMVFGERHALCHGLNKVRLQFEAFNSLKAEATELGVALEGNPGIAALGVKIAEAKAARTSPEHSKSRQQVLLDRVKTLLISSKLFKYPEETAEVLVFGFRFGGTLFCGKRGCALDSVANNVQRGSGHRGGMAPRIIKSALNELLGAGVVHLTNGYSLSVSLDDIPNSNARQAAQAVLDFYNK